MFFMNCMREEREEIENNTPVSVYSNTDSNSIHWLKLLKLAKHLGGTNLTWDDNCNNFKSSAIRDFLDVRLGLENSFNLTDAQINSLMGNKELLNDRN